MQSYAQTTGLSWQTHSAALEKIKADVNQLQQNMRGSTVTQNRSQRLAAGSNRSHYHARE